MIGNSMKPTLSFLCLINLKQQKNYVTGDIVVFKNNDRLFFPYYCHRIISIVKNLFTAKGDNKEKSDRFEINVPIENIVGKVIDFKKIL